MYYYAYIAKRWERPSVLEFDRHIKKEIAGCWFELGMQLNIPTPQLKKIHANYPQNFNLCSLKMFEYWLQVSINPTWQGLIEALDKIRYYSLRKKSVGTF